MLVPLYRKHRGYLAGDITFADLIGIGEGSGVLHWHRPADSRSVRFPGGFDVSVNAVLSKYTAPLANERVLPEFDASAGVAALILSGER